MQNLNKINGAFIGSLQLVYEKDESNTMPDNKLLLQSHINEVPCGTTKQINLKPFTCLSGQALYGCISGNCLEHRDVPIFLAIWHGI